MTDPVTQSAPGARRELIAFRIAEQEFCVDIMQVREIRGWTPATPLPRTPSYMKGVINLRGAIVPIIDLRIKFNLPVVTYDQFTVVIILNVMKRIIGVVVDSVSDVIALAHGAIKPPPEFGSTFNTEYLMGLATVEERMLILVDIERLMSSGEMALLNETND